jgi:hypothetical protein
MTEQERLDCTDPPAMRKFVRGQVSEREISETMLSLIIACRLSRCGLLLAALLVAGCLPNVAWLPDSSGLVFTEKSNRRLVRYDLKTKKRQVLVEDSGADTPWPSISPDGKLIAVAAWRRPRHQPGTLQIIAYRASGAEAWRSTRFKWMTSFSLDPDETYVFWVTKARLLVSAGPATALYDRDRDRLVRLGDVVPFFAMPTPVRPDGEGFLAWKATEDGQTELAFVNWRGKVRPIPGRLPSDLDFPFGLPLHWEKDTAVVNLPTMTLRADTRTGKLTRSNDRPTVLPAREKLVVAHPFPRARTVLCCYREELLRRGEEDHVYRVELHDLAARKRQVLLGRYDVHYDVPPRVFPSPDGKMVALYHSPERTKMKLAIFDATGKKVADLDVERW